LSGSGFLLDTRVLIWWLAEPSRLSSTATRCIAAPVNQICCSVVNFREIQIQVKLGKLDLDLLLLEIRRWVVDQQGWLLLPVQWPHILRLDQVPVGTVRCVCQEHVGPLPSSASTAAPHRVLPSLTSCSKPSLPPRIWLIIQACRTRLNSCR
jgi:PIN domain nuclease of toxin-antitoxin system